jgi:hypothetical protein
MKRAPMPSLDETMAGLPLELARPWPEGVPKDGKSPNEQGLCASCFYPFDGDRRRYDNAYFHHRCAAFHERLVLGDDAGPGLLEHLDAMEARRSFLTRLGAEAGKLGIDRQKLATAVERATHAES